MMRYIINSIVSLSFFLAMKWKTVLTVMNLTYAYDQLTKIIKRFYFAAEYLPLFSKGKCHVISN